ncbi:MAG: DUF484 family protein, partial [Anaerolineales bacterium]|nr:DUF484 family protein [Anaerolineales bacterium]
MGKITLRIKMLTIYICIGIIILMITGGWLFGKFKHDRFSELERELNNQIKYIDFALENFLLGVEFDIKSLAANDLVRTTNDSNFTNFLDADPATFEYHYSDLEKEIIKILKTYRTTHPYVNSVYMGRENGSFVRSHPRSEPTQYDPRERPWYQLGKENPGQVMRTAAYPSVTTSDVNIGIVTALVDDNGEVYGVLGTDITLYSLTDYLADIEVGHQGEIILIEDSGIILASLDKDLQFKNISTLIGDENAAQLQASQGVLSYEKDSESCYLFFYTSPKFGWKIAIEIPVQVIDQEIQNAIMPALYSLTLALILVILFTFAGLVLTVIRPLTHLNDVALEITRTGELDRQVNVSSDDEIGNLATSFNRMIKSLKEKESAITASQAELERHKEHLEELVQERTRELSVANSELAVLNQIRRDILTILDLEKLLPTIVQRVMDTLKADRCTLFLYDDVNAVLRVRAVQGYKAERLVDFSYQPGEEIVGTAFAAGQIQYAPDLDDIPDIPRRDDIRSVLAVPLASSTSGIQGVISVTSLNPGAFKPNQQQLLETIAGQIARTIENARLYKSTEDNANNLANLYKVGKKISSTLELDTILQSIVDEAKKLVNANKSLILLIDKEKKRVQAVGRGYTPDQLKTHSYQEILNGISGWVLDEKKPTLSVDIRTDKRNRAQALESAIKSGDRSAAIAPLIIEDQAIGTLTVINSGQSKVFSDYDLNLVIMLAGQAAIAIQNAQLYEAAQEADRLKSAFLASMSHELRTPLNSIIGFTGIILQGLAGPLNEEQQKQMGMVRDSARHLLSLINDVLDISKIEAGQLPIGAGQFNMRTAIENVIRSVSPLADKKDLMLVTNISPEVGSIISDQRRVEQILINLVNNAIKFTEKGTVRVDSQYRDGFIVTSVQDTGIGIKVGDRIKLFQVF